jgi:hypothetical protein
MNNTISQPKQFNSGRSLHLFRILCLAFCLFILRGPLFAQSIAAPYDILINEFMADPLPLANITISLPNSEFIELYNRTTKTFNLKDFKIYNGTVSTVLPAFTLKPNSYVVIYTQKTGIDFAIKDTLPVTKLVTLSNPNDTFHLVSPEGRVIDAASYDLSFYQSSKKADGGWTLERTSPNAPCNPMAWTASEDLRGGTPGRRNSVALDSVDRQPPEIERYYMKNDQTIVLLFNKSLDLTLAEQALQYSFSENIKVSSANCLSPMFQIVQLKLGTTLLPKTSYQLLVKKTLKDCQGNPLSKIDTLRIQLPEKMVTNDLIINEILTNPETGGSRFVELYNRSEKVVDIASLKIGDKSKNDIKIITSNFLLFPRQYVALSEVPTYIQKRYNALGFRKQMIKNKLPTWDEKAGNVILYFVDGTKLIVLDSFNYAQSWHNPLIANTDGVSLEKINPNLPSKQASSWQSAAQTRGFATPAQENSQFLPIDTPSVSRVSKNVFQLEKKTFSPDGDGFEDFLLLNYQLDKAGYVASIRIFDDKGRLVKTLVNNELLETEGSLKWAGDTSEGLKTRLGIYVVAIELTSPTGKVENMKLACVVATRM